MPSFIGVYAQNELSKIRNVKLPFSLIVNVDYSEQSGSHWLSVHVTKHSVEIFDSLGFDKRYFSTSTNIIVKFIDKYSFNRNLLTSPVLQPCNSALCGFYSIYFILWRQFYNYKQCLSRFGSNRKRNDERLLHFLTTL